VAALLAALVLTSAAAQERTGAWVDEVIVVEEPSDAAAILQLKIGGIDVVARTMTDPAIARDVAADPNLAYVRVLGAYDELSFNPVGPRFPDGRLNPFAVPRIREAMSKLIDREHIAREIYGGMAVPKFTSLNSAFVDYARLIDVMRVIERRYAHNPELAEQIITEEMLALGATKVGDRWQYQGQPVEIHFIIRVEDARLHIGDYVSGLLEDIGFTVNRLYRTAAEAGPIWLAGDPADGRWHIVTGGWITTVVARDQATNFDFFYTPRGLPRPLWLAYTPSPEFDEVADRLNRRDFTTMEERRELFARAVELAKQNSVRVWLVDRLAFAPFRAEIRVTADLAGGIAGAWLWPHTIRRGEEVGGRVTIAQPSMLTAPWNPIGGSNWIFDMMLIRATADMPTLWDPYTGLHWPQRLERAEVFVQEGLPVGVTHDWVSLEFLPEIPVPADAWSDWDAAEQRWITAGERFPEGVTARTKVRLHYPEDLFETSTWHDGSPLSLADLVFAFITGFDRAKEESAIFDRAAVPLFESFMENFRGLRIVSERPLVVEFFTDAIDLDAEWSAYLAAWGFWPWWTQGPGAWHNVALGVLAETNRELAFTEAKADELGVEHMSLIAGPSLEILRRHLATAAAEGFLPYTNVLSQFATPAEVSQRWANLQAWHEDKGHFWVGLGPLYLEAAFPLERTVHLRRFEAFPDPAGKWDRFVEPMVATVEVEGPARITSGQEATFDVWVTFRDEPYAAADIDTVTYLVFDATGALALRGEAQLVNDGHYTVTLSAEETARLPVGVNRLEVAVVPLLVSIPSFDSLEFVTIQ
jgi:peptide/nickel transport system substrate-binding protein